MTTALHQVIIKREAKENDTHPKLTTTSSKEHKMNYKELQTALKDLRNKGFELQVKLNAKKEVLEAELVRLQGLQEVVQEVVQEEEDIWLVVCDSTDSGTTEEPIKDIQSISTYSYQLCLSPALDIVINESEPDISSTYVNPLIIFLLPILVILLTLTLSIKLLSKVLKLSIPFVLQRYKSKLTGYTSTATIIPI